MTPLEEVLSFPSTIRGEDRSLRPTFRCWWEARISPRDPPGSGDLVRVRGSPLGRRSWLSALPPTPSTIPIPPSSSSSSRPIRSLHVRLVCQRLYDDAHARRHDDRRPAAGAAAVRQVAQRRAARVVLPLHLHGRRGGRILRQAARGENAPSKKLGKEHEVLSLSGAPTLSCCFPRSPLSPSRYTRCGME